MKKIALLLFALACAANAHAQMLSSNSPSPQHTMRTWFDIQAVQHIGLNNWTGQRFVDDLLPPTSMTEIRGSVNIPLFRHAGLFADMGVGIMPAPRKSTPDIMSFPLPTAGARYFLKEEISNGIMDNASANFKMTVGLFGRFSSGKLNVMPYLGVGYMVVRAPSYEAVIKEDGTNMQYNASLFWMADEGYSETTLGYLTGRLNFSYPLSTRVNLLLGLEYTCYFTRPTFSAVYTNSFNYNIVKEYRIKGNRVNMLGVSLGFSFM